MSVKILVVDDEPDLQSLIQVKFRKAIKNNEYDFYFASNGQEALGILHKDTDLNIILTDINMPVMDGLTLLAELGQLNRPYKAIIVSAYGDMANIRTAMNRGASDFVVKPIDFTDFETTLRKIIDEYQRTIEAVSTKHKLSVIHKELDVAKSIQESMLPTEFTQLAGYRMQIVGKMIPAKEVGGDFYDFFAIDDHRVAVFIADVSGKSISACLYMVVTKSLLRALAKRQLSCSEVISQMNELLSTENRSCMFVTAFYGIIDLKEGVISYCNAGHNSPYIVRKERTIEAIGKENSIALGIGFPPAIDYQDHTVPFGEGECLFLYTDGVTEAMNEQGQQFSEEVLLNLLKANGDDPSIAVILEEVYKQVKTFAGTTPQSDDLTMLAVRYSKA
jgi:sigma-B regulation protein RsbU (phosphoserine phosphatase)